MKTTISLIALMLTLAMVLPVFGQEKVSGRIVEKMLKMKKSHFPMPTFIGWGLPRVQ